MAKQKAQISGSSSKKNSTNNASPKPKKGRPKKIDLGKTGSPAGTSTPKSPRKQKPKVSKSVSPKASTKPQTPKSARLQSKKPKVVPMSEPSTRPLRSTAGKLSAVSRPIIQEAMDVPDMNHSGAESRNAGWFQSCSLM